MGPDDRDPVSVHLEDYVYPDSLQGLPGLKARVAELAESWELSKVRWACGGRRVHAPEVEMELLETRRTHLWDHEIKGSPLSLAARFMERIR